MEFLIILLLVVAVVLFQFLQPINDHKRVSTFPTHRYNLLSGERDLFRSVSIIFCHLMKVDGQITKIELNECKTFLYSEFTPEAANLILSHIKCYAKEMDPSNAVDASFYECVRKKFSYDRRVSFLNGMFKVAAIDSKIVRVEADIIMRCAQSMAVRDVDIDRLKGFYAYGFAWEESEMTP